MSTSPRPSARRELHAVIRIDSGILAANSEREWRTIVKFDLILALGLYNSNRFYHIDILCVGCRDQKCALSEMKATRLAEVLRW
jgi:hypothetical protein